MSIFSQKKTFPNGKIPSDQPLTVKISINVQRKYENYGEPTDVADLKIEQKLIAGSAAREKVIKQEVESILSEAYDKVNQMIETSNLLADGQVEDIQK